LGTLEGIHLSTSLKYHLTKFNTPPGDRRNTADRFSAAIGNGKVRICLVSLDYKPYRSSGLTIYAEDLARGLTELGHSVTVLAARRPGLPTIQRLDGVELCRVPIDSSHWIGYSWRAAGWLRRMEQKSPFEIVHFLDIHFAYAYHGFFVASLMQSFRQRLTARHGWPCHTGGIDMARRQAYYRIARRFMERPSLARAAGLIANCRSTRDEYIAHYGVSPARIGLAVQGIDTERFRPMPADDLRRCLKLEGRRVVLFVGFITPRKGLEYLLQAMHLLPRDVHLVIVGRWEPHYRAYCRKALGALQDRVLEVGFIPDEQRACYYSMADAYVAPSLLEGLGITPIEAMACGTPAIVTSASSGPEEVGEAGLVVPPCDPEALATAIRCLLEDHDLRQRLGQQGRERVLQQFTYRRMAVLTQQTYQRFVHGE
jgi:glycosyltransferase involved in cell wall biosynthesis